jgi:hypothetical protein
MPKALHFIFEDAEIYFGICFAVIANRLFCSR